MDPNAFEKYLAERYQCQIVWYDKKATLNKTLYSLFQWPVIVFSAITPILVVINENKARWAAVVISALVAIGTTAMKSFQFHENWLNYRTICETLRKEIHYYRARTSAYSNVPDPEAVFVERVEAMISRENTMWLTTAKQSDHDSKSKQKDDLS